MATERKGKAAPMYVRIEPSRELDALTAAHLTRQLLQVPLQADIVIDMSGVTFCDSNGLGAILTGLDHRAGPGTTTIRNPTLPVRRLIDLCGLTETLPIETDDPHGRGFLDDGERSAARLDRSA